MNDLKTLEARLKTATDRISAALAENSDTTEIATENAQLRQKLAAAKEQRTSDLAELNELLDHLRPLMEGKADA